MYESYLELPLKHRGIEHSSDDRIVALTRWDFGVSSCFLLSFFLYFFICLALSLGRVQCPCIAKMKEGSCGEQFIAAYRCFLQSDEEPKGMG